MEYKIRNNIVTLNIAKKLNAAFVNISLKDQRNVKGINPNLSELDSFPTTTIRKQFPDTIVVSVGQKGLR